MMDNSNQTLNELLYYCGEQKPVGTLMLTGRWGCGKSYFIKNTFEPTIKEKLDAIVVTVSLFGLDTLDAVKKSVHSEWLNKTNFGGNGKKVSSFVGKAGKALEKLSDNVDVKNLKLAGTIATGASLLYEMVPIRSEVGGHPIILVFDDFERSTIDKVDLLGCINEYCENEGFHVIIVAYEDVILGIQEKRISAQEEHNKDLGKSLKSQKRCGNGNGNDEGKITTEQLIKTASVLGEAIGTKLGEHKDSYNLNYREVKEKIVERTIRYVPDYKAFVHDVVTGYVSDSKKYKMFLVDNECRLLHVFLDEQNNDDQNNRSITADEVGGNAEHTAKYNETVSNFRSFRVALLGFERVYDILSGYDDNELDGVENWLDTFVRQTISKRNNGTRNANSHYGGIFEDQDIKRDFPDYNSSYLVPAIRDWIDQGTWDEQYVREGLHAWIQRRKPVKKEPWEELRDATIQYIDEETIAQGWPVLLDKAYKGQLTLDEYINLIYNVQLSAEYSYRFDPYPDWNRIYDAVQEIIHEAINNDTVREITPHRECPNDVAPTAPEKKIYNLIEDLMTGNEVICDSNRKRYIEAMNSDNASNLFSIFRVKSYNVFDEEMAEATLKAYRNCAILYRPDFIGEFRDMWAPVASYVRLDIDKTINGFKYLEDGLNGYSAELKASGKPVQMTNAQKFAAVAKDIKTGLLKEKVRRETQEENETEQIGDE